MNPRIFIMTVLLFFCAAIHGQHQYNHHWYFGNRAALDFHYNPPLVKTDSRMDTYRSAASVSDEKTGELLFYTNGNSFWNRYGEMIDSNFQGGSVEDVVIIPLKDFVNRFMVFSFSGYHLVDMVANKGKGAILEKKTFPLRSTINRMTAVKHCLSESYWLITLESQNFCAYLIHPNGEIDLPVVSANPDVNSGSYVGDFISSNNGERLALTTYTVNSTSFAEPRIFEFNKRCGTVKSGTVLLPMKSDWDYPHGIAFSPNDQLIYVTYGYQKSQLVQYNLADPNDYQLIAESPENFNQMACGPDGKLYITTHIGSVPSNKLDVVLYPNVKGNGCTYRENYLRVQGATNFEVPNMVINHSGGCDENGNFEMIVDSGACLGDAVSFHMKGSSAGVDSIRWFFREQTGSSLSDRSPKTQYTYTDTGIYFPQAVVYFCGHKDTFRFRTVISAPLKPRLGNDTTLCAGDSISIGNPSLKGQFRWNNGSTDASIKVKTAGHYILTYNHRGCVRGDSITINYYTPISMLLGDQYYICEEEKKLVKLDAGKGFIHYLWYPTNDTTQWIEVGKKGEYFVFVKDFRGCKADDHSLISERCDLRVYIPNAFSPNDDGLNDTYNIVAEHAESVAFEIYSRWGELLFKGTGKMGWDGTYNGQPASQGIYSVKVKVQGFQNKKSVYRSYSGLIHLIK